jgi:hypothetical protein
MSERSVRQVTVAFLSLKVLGATAWWLMLFLAPETRAPFLAPGAPDSMLLAFFIPDLFFYLGAGLAAAIGIARHRSWGWSVLCIHTGASLYASVYALSLPLLSGGGWWGALLMSPSLVVLPWIAWRLRPGAPP